MPLFGPFDMIIADPPYGDTALSWDKQVAGWEAAALACLRPTGSMWVFGSMRYFLTTGLPPGWKLAQDIVWEKHNGSGFAADRFKRVHEHAVHLYRADAPWSGVFNAVQRVPGVVRASATIKSRKGLPHTGEVAERGYEYGDTRLMRSVIPMHSMHGQAIHPTEKPADLLEILIRTSCPPGGVVGDLFAGSGAAGEAAHRAGCDYVGCEIDAQMAEKAQTRLRGLAS